MKKVIYLGNVLSKHGYTPTTVETLGNRLKEEFEVVQVSDYKSWVVRLLHMWFTVLKASKNDVIIIDTYSSIAFHFAWTSGCIAYLKKIPYIPFLHGGNLPSRMDKSVSICRFFFKNAKKIISPSGFLKEEAEKRFPVAVEVIPNFIDIKNYANCKKKFDTIRLLWVRSFHKIYNPQMAIHILHQLHDKGFTNTKLCMIGPDKDGTLDKVIELAENLGVREKLETTGRLSKAEWIEKSKEFNFFINTTNFDNTPVSVMEAMALGFPVITTNVGGIPYLFKNDYEGIMVSSNDITGVVDILIYLFSKPEKSLELSQNARRKAESWDWSKVKLLWEDLVTEIN